MFYSHEILTSPEHGVATIWLVATVGSRSITRKLNRKTILDVDVPKACDVIINPEAPMALRLQGSLLYGVSRVYNQQCGYTLVDVQTMHDRMKSILKVVHGTAIDPSAGKARPDQLILPYDPSFLPEINLALNVDLSKLDLRPGQSEGQTSSLKSPEPSQTLPAPGNLQLDIPSDDPFHLGGFAGLGSENDIPGSVQRSAGPLDRALGLEFGDEQGVLLQPDFEFDEDGNIVELPGRCQIEPKETPISRKDNVGGNDAWDHQAMPVDEQMDLGIAEDNASRDTNEPQQQRAESKAQDEEDVSEHDIRMQQTRKSVKRMVADSKIALRNTDLAQWNNEYLLNMAVATKQKQSNKLPTLSKKNAAFWVFGQGIASVGIGLGASREPHPLRHFSGDDLYDLLNPTRPRGRKRCRPRSDSESELRRVRRKADGEEDQIGRGGLPDEAIMQDEPEPEMGRHAPSSIHDDHSSQMPWNITASIQSSRHGSSAQPFRGFGSVELSAHGLAESASRGRIQEAMLARSRSRLTSASPLAGRGGFPFDIENLGAEADIDLDLDMYLQSELDPDRHTVSADADGGSGTATTAGLSRPGMQRKLLASSLDQESLNFLDFLNSKTQPEPDDGGDQHGKQDTTSEITSFSSLLPPENTSRIVATQALMHVLTLATKGFLGVRQDPYVDESSDEVGARYRYGEIFLRLAC